MALCLFAPPIVRAETPAPDGWRFPQESDYSDDWLKYRETYPVPFHVKSDFNGDGLADDAWIVIPRKGTGGGLCVLLSREEGAPDVIWLDRGKMIDAPQSVGIVAVPPGQYRTACGKGYFECGPGEPGKLDLSLPSFQFIYFGKAGILYWWDAGKKSFNTTAMSD
ncbi:MAG: hypothetical protein ACM3NF_08370 [Gemmatimonadota bacterium]